MTDSKDKEQKETQALEDLFRTHGCEDFRWLDPDDIVTAQWVRMKCIFGCREYGQRACCPPNVPSVDECERFFSEYRSAAVFHFWKKVEDPDDRHAWTRSVNMELSKLEREVFISGYQKAFLLYMDSCEICAECTPDRDLCREPIKARPAPEALAIDVFSTVRKIGYPIEVLSDYSQTMNRYAFLLIE